jgi:hypothetical protein
MKRHTRIDEKWVHYNVNYVYVDFSSKRYTFRSYYPATAIVIQIRIFITNKLSKLNISSLDCFVQKSSITMECAPFHLWKIFSFSQTKITEWRKTFPPSPTFFLRHIPVVILYLNVMFT